MWQALVFAAALAVAGGAQAQTKKDLVQKVLQLQQSGIENLGRALAAQITQQIFQATGQALGSVPTDKREAMGRELQAEIKKFHDEIEPLYRDQAVKQSATVVGAMLEERYSEDELKQLVAWLESPVSKKYEQIARDSTTALQQKVAAELKPVVEPKLRVLEQTVGKRLGLPKQPASNAASAPAKK
jgi:hypothetical protein